MGNLIKKENITITKNTTQTKEKLKLDLKKTHLKFLSKEKIESKTISKGKDPTKV